MQRALRFLLNLHRGEEKRALLFLLVGLTWGIGCYGSLSLGEGLFLEQLGTAGLPSMYLGASFFLCVFSALILYNLSKKRVSSKTLFLLPITCVLICNSYLLWHLITYHTIPRMPLFIYRVLIWGLTILSYTNFWGFVDQFFNLQDAKRHFGIFNAVIFLSDFIGAGVVNRIQNIGVQNILIFFILVLAMTYPLVHYLSKSLKNLSEDHELFLDTGYPPPISKALKLCLKDKYTFYLLSFYFLMQLLAIATEFNYLQIFEKAFANHDQFELTMHITQCSSWISLGNMCFALFAYSRIVKNIGINNIILLAPLCFISLFSCWSIKTSISIATLGMVAREGLTYALDDNNLQLLVYGVPNKIRHQIRIAIESFIEPIGMFVWAIVCFFLPYQYTACLIISLISILLALMLRAHYAHAILRNLSSEAIYLKRSMVDWMHSMSTHEKRQVERLLLTHLKHQHERHQTFAFQHLLSLGSRSVLPSLLAHMNKLSLSNKLKTIAMLKNSLWAKDFLTLELLRRWLSVTPHPAIASAIHLYFAEHNLLKVSDIAEDLYDEPGERLSAAILIARRQESAGIYRDLADKRLNELLRSPLTQYISIGLSVLCLERDEKNMEILMNFLDSPEEPIILQACKAIQASIRPLHKAYGKRLIEALKHFPHHSEACNSLLAAIGVVLDPSLIKDFITTIAQLKSSSRKTAESILSGLPKEFAHSLLTVLSDNSLHNRCRLIAAKTLCRIDSKLLTKHSYKVVKSKALKALFYEYHKNYIQARYPHYNLTLLVNTLESNYHSEVNFMLEFLGIVGSVEHSDVLIRALTGKNLKAKAQALESLEKNCDNYLFSLLAPFMNNTEQHSEKYYFKCGITPLTLKELLNMMENSPSYLSKLTSRQLREELESCDPEFHPAPYQTGEGHSDDTKNLASLFTI